MADSCGYDVDQDVGPFHYREFVEVTNQKIGGKCPANTHEPQGQYGWSRKGSTNRTGPSNQRPILDILGDTSTYKAIGLIIAAAGLAYIGVKLWMGGPETQTVSTQTGQRLA